MASKIRKQILSAAIELFAQHGIDGTTTKEISTRAAVTEMSLFRLFGSKDRLFEEVLQSVCRDQMTPEMFGELLDCEGEFCEVVGDVLRRLYKQLGREFPRLVVFANLSRPKLANSVFGARSSRIIQLLAQRIDRELGHKRATKIAYSAAYAILADLFTYKLNRDLYDHPLKEHEFVDAAIRIWTTAMAHLAE
jgi:AcrR family transcriptional regulator